MKILRTTLYDDDNDTIIVMAETNVENEEDIERHIENWHSIKTAFKRNEVLEDEQALDAKEKLDLTEPH